MFSAYIVGPNIFSISVYEVPLQYFFNNFFFFFTSSELRYTPIIYYRWGKKFIHFFFYSLYSVVFFVVRKRFVRLNAAILLVMIRGLDGCAWCRVLFGSMLAMFE